MSVKTENIKKWKTKSFLNMIKVLIKDFLLCFYYFHIFLFCIRLPFFDILIFSGLYVFYRHNAVT